VVGGGLPVARGPVAGAGRSVARCWEARCWEAVASCRKPVARRLVDGCGCGLIQKCLGERCVLKQYRKCRMGPLKAALDWNKGSAIGCL
jgi:hypothetical protein